MARFRDTSGTEWTVELDAFVLDAIRSALSIDLADVSAGGYARLDNDIDLVKVVALCCEQPFRQMAKTVRKHAISAARKAVMEAARDFFPTSEWSEMQSALQATKDQKTTRKTMAAEMARAAPLLEMISQLPPAMQEGAIQELQKAIREAGGDGMSLERLQALTSASDQDSKPSKPATDSPASAESVPAG